MAMLKVFAALALTCILQVNAEVKTVHLKHHFKDFNVYFERGNLNKNEFIYGLCDKVVNQPQRVCNVVREVKRFDDKSSNSTCKVNLADETKPNGVVGYNVRVVPYDEFKSVVFWEYKVKDVFYYKFSTVYFADKCKVVHAEIPVSKEVYEKFVDVQFVPIYFEADKKDFTNLLVCSGKYCQYKIDSEGYVKSEVNVTLATIGQKHRVFLVKPFHTKKVKAFVKLAIAYYTFDMDEVDILKMVEKVHFEPQSDFVYSTVHDTAGICFLNDDHLYECTQYNVKNENEYLTKPDFSGYEVHGVSMYNLPHQSGYFFLNDYRDGSVYKFPSHEYNVTKFDVNGVRQGYFSFTDFDCNFTENSVYGQFYHEKDDEYCLSLACYDGPVENRKDKEYSGYLGFTVKCFHENDLKK